MFVVVASKFWSASKSHERTRCIWKCSRVRSRTRRSRKRRRRRQRLPFPPETTTTMDSSLLLKDRNCCFSALSSLLYALHHHIFHPKGQKNVESPTRGETPKESKKKCEHPKGKEEKEDARAGRVRNERVTCFACFFATLCFFSLPREEDATEKETSAPSRVRSTPVLRNVCLCNREQKKNREPFLFSQGKKSTQKI